MINRVRETSVTAALIERDGLLLLARRATADHGSGGWEFPGGKVEPGETPAACLAREIREELCLDVAIGPMAGELLYPYARGTIRLLVFNVTVTGGTLTPTAHEEIAWVAPRDLMRYDLLPADRVFVEQHFSGRTDAATGTFHVYLHVPFCVRKCRYCGFASVAAQDALHVPYFAALEREARQACALVCEPASTVYIGGGTPSCVDAAVLVQTLDAVRATCGVAAGAEITVECNPGSLRRAWADTLRDAGVNRFSLGVQSLDDGDLGRLGRPHNAADARAAFRLLRDAGCRNVSVDLMCGVPGQTEQSLTASLEEIARQWQPEHLSLYTLSIEPGTPFARWHKAHTHGWQWPSDDETMDWYWHACDMLATAGYTQYEISNFALPGFASRHNSAYWDTRCRYLGLGAAAHSYLPIKDVMRRCRNIKDVRAYIRKMTAGEPVRRLEKNLTSYQKLGEYILLGLRRMRGVAVEPEHEAAFGTVIAQQIADGLIVRNADRRIALTRRGIELANQVMAEYV